MNPLPISESELHAYIDGLLPESRCAEIERYLSTHPEEAERVRIYREQMQAIRTLFGPSLDEAIPRRLIEAARTPPKATSTRQRARWLSLLSLERVAASIAIAFVGTAAGWVGRGVMQQAPLMACSTGLTASSAMPCPQGWTSANSREWPPPSMHNWNRDDERRARP
jgi:anti-sigma factor RsiW